MNPEVRIVLHATRALRVRHGDVTAPVPLARLALDGAPGDVILVRVQPLLMQPRELFGGRHRLALEVLIRPGAHRRVLNPGDAQVPGRDRQAPHLRSRRWPAHDRCQYDECLFRIHRLPPIHYPFAHASILPAAYAL